MKVRINDRLTVLTPDEAIDAIATAYERLFSTPYEYARIDAPTLAILVAKTALETGHWRKIHCFNFGNIKGADPITGLFTMYKCDELLKPEVAQRYLAKAQLRADGSGLPNAMLTSKGKDTWTVAFWPDHSQCEFRAYGSASSGAYEYLRLLAIDTKPDDDKPNRYAAAWLAVDKYDDPYAFAHELKRAGYYTATEASYTAGVVALRNQYLPQCREYLAKAQDDIVTTPISIHDADTIPPVAPSIDRDRIFGLIALSLDQAKRDFFDSDPDDTVTEV